MPRKPATSTASCAVEPGTASRRKTAGDSVLTYQFKLTLQNVEPPVWRRIRVADCTLGKLHSYIQAAFGWWNYHLHQFVIAGRRYGLPDPDGMDFGLETLDEDQVKLSDLLKPTSKSAKWMYEYDFGDGWLHLISLEKIESTPKKEATPRCLEGARACPPEDCGGPPGYENYLEVMADKRHPEHREMKAWRGPFDPESFDAERATKEMRMVR